MNRPIRLAREALEPPREIEQPDAYAFGTEVGPNYQLCNGRLPPQKPLNLPKPVVYSVCLYCLDRIQPGGIRHRPLGSCKDGSFPQLFCPETVCFSEVV